MSASALLNLALALALALSALALVRLAHESRRLFAAIERAQAE